MSTVGVSVSGTPWDSADAAGPCADIACLSLLTPPHPGMGAMLWLQCPEHGPHSWGSQLCPCSWCWLSPLTLGGCGRGTAGQPPAVSA